MPLLVSIHIQAGVTEKHHLMFSSFKKSTFQNLYSVFPTLVSIVVQGSCICVWIIWLILFPTQLLARRSECSLCLKTRHESKYEFKDCWVCSYTYSEKSILFYTCKQNTFSVRESKVLVVLHFESIRVFNNSFTCRVSVAVGLRFSHHLNFSNELLMRGQLLMEIRKTFIEELCWGKVCYLIMLWYKSLQL